MQIDCETHDLAVIEAARLKRRVEELEAKLKRYTDLYAEAYGGEGWDDHMLAVAFEKVHLGDDV